MNLKEIKELIEFLIEKDVAEFELERGDVKVRIKRGQAAALYAPAPSPNKTPISRPLVVRSNMRDCNSAQTKSTLFACPL